jgi:hypothetical protein
MGGGAHPYAARSKSMSTVAKILVVVNLILAGGFLASASSFLGNQDQWRTKHDTVKTDLTEEVDRERSRADQERNRATELTNQLTDARVDVTTSQNSANLFKGQAEVLATELAQTSAQLTRATNALNEAGRTVNAQQNLITGLQAERNALADATRVAQDQKDAALRTVNQLQIQVESYQANKQQNEARIAELEARVRSLELTVETVGRRFPQAAADLALEQPSLPPGQVLDVDNAAGLAVISYGKEDGVKPGHKFTVFRGRDYVGTLVITDAEARHSAGSVVRDLSKGPIQRGDQVLSR